MTVWSTALLAHKAFDRSGKSVFKPRRFGTVGLPCLSQAAIVMPISLMRQLRLKVTELVSDKVRV